MTFADILNILGLTIGVISAVLLYLWPPMTIEYTEDGAQKFSFKAAPTEEGKQAYRKRKTRSKFALALLIVSFAMQLASAVLQQLGI